MEFLHPHISSTIVDNSGVVMDTTSSPNTGTVLFAPFFSEKGKDNEIVEWTDPTAFIAEHGTPNFRDYGQTEYNVVRWLLSGGVVRGLRLMPKDAAYANAFVTVQVDATNESQVAVKTIIESFGDITTEEELETKLTEAVTTDDEGQPLAEKVVRKRLFAVIPNGRGEYGKEYKFTLKLNTLYKDTYDFPLYNFEVLKTSKKGEDYTVEGPFVVALKPDALAIDGKSLYIQNVIDRYASAVKIVTNEDAYYELEELLDDSANCSVKYTGYTVAAGAVTATADQTGSLFEAINASRGITGTYNGKTVATDAKYTTVEEIDFIFGGDRKGTAISDLLADTDAQVYIKSALTENETGIDMGYSLKGGTDSLNGSIDTKDETQLNAIRDELLKAAFGAGDTEYGEGKIVPAAAIDKKIFEVRNYPVDVVLDAGFSDAVKLAMQSFSELRKDIFIFYDLPVKNNGTVEKAITLRNSYSILNKYDSALFGQTFVVSDSYTTADIKVTMSYFLATLIPVHDRVYGCHRPMAGLQRGQIPEFKKMSFNPSEQEKENLYNAQINYVEQTTRGSRISSQITMQEKATALSNINNVRTLFLIIRDIENVADNYEFEYADADTIINFQSSVNNALSNWNKACSSISGTVYQSDYDRQQKIARVRLDIVFKDIIERIAIEINVGK